MDIFPERFKQLKSAKNVTYDNIAEYLGLKQRTIKGYSAGNIKPDYKGLIALADYFGVSIDYLVGRTDKPDVNK